MNIAIYVRKSKLVCQSESIENQIKICEDYCKKHFGTYKLFIYSDNGFTAKHTNRPEFQRMLEEIKINKINYIITYKLDRLCRNVHDFVNLVELFDNSNVKFTSVKENFDLESTTGKMIALIYSMFSQIEREAISERIRDNMYESAKSGRWLGGPAPLGYKFYRVEENNKNITYLQLDNESSYVIEDIYNKFLQFKSLTKVTNYAYKNGIVGPRGNSLNLTTINNILRNPIYVKSSNEVVQFLKNENMSVFGTPDGVHGILTYGKKNIFSINPIAAISKHIGIINSDIWLEVQSILLENSQKFPRQGSGKKALLSGLLKCDLCGSNMRISYKKNKNTGIEHSYYICGKKKQLGTIACNCSNLNSQFIDNMVLNSIGGINIDKLIDTYKKNNFSNYNIDSDKKELNLLSKSIKSKENSMKSLSSRLCLTDNKKVLDTIIYKMENLAEEIKSLEFKYNDLKNKIVNIDNSHIQDVNYIIHHFDLFVKDQSIDLKRDLINTLIETIIWNPTTKQLDIIFKQ